MRDIKPTQCKISVITDLPDESNFEEWLNQQAAQYALTFALAFADDGVIWGRFDGAWKWSGESFAVSPPLRWNTLQQIRLFGANAEVFLWRANGAWAGRVIVDGAGEIREYFDEAQLLWGAKDGEEKNGFLLMRDGGQGLRHTPPVKIANEGKLHTRNYLDYDQDGSMKIIASRLVDAKSEEMTK